MARRIENADKPYLLHVAPYAAHARLKEIYPAEPIFPPAMRDRAGPGSPPATVAPGAATASRRATSWARRDRAVNVPTYLRGGRTSPAPAWRTDPARSPATRH